jgi:hypothetical protein
MTENQKCTASNGDHCWHTHGSTNWASSSGASEQSFHCCYCGTTKVVRTEARVLASEQVHGPYLMWGGS